MANPPSNSAVLENKGPAKEITADDVLDLFSQDDDKTDQSLKDTEKVVPNKEKEPEEKKEKELELVDEDEEVEKLDLAEKEPELEIDAPPRKKEILKEYPELFKKFPFLEKMLYRDKQYNELFGSFDDAREVAERAESFAEFEEQLLSGNIEDTLREVKDSDESAFDKIIDNYLPTLAKIDRGAYLHVTGNLNRRLIMEMWQEASDTGNEDLKNAALLVNQFVFGTSKFTAPQARAKVEEDTGKEEVERERLNLVKERYEGHRDEINTKVDNTLRATVDSYIDPRSQMSPYVKRNAVTDAMKYLGEFLDNDPTIVRNLDKLWRASFDSKFSRDSLDRVKSYYLGKARTFLKEAILKARAEALKDSRPLRDKETDETEEEETPVRRKPVNPGKPSTERGKEKGQRKGESVTEFFMRD